MADYDRRQSDHHNSRKRRYRSEHHDSFDPRQQRRRTETAPIWSRLRRQLLGLADSPLRQWAGEVQSVARMVTERYDDESLRELFLGLVIQVVTEQPLKTPFVAAVLLVINSLKPEFMPLLLARLADALASKITLGEWRQVKLLLKLLACLQPCLEGDGIFPLLEELFGRAADLQTASSDDTIGTEIVKIILLTIPYAMAANPDQLQHKAAELMDKTDIIASEPHALQALVDPYHPEGAEKSPAASLSLCMLLQKQLQTEASNGWPLAFLPRPWIMPPEETEARDRLASAPKHALPAISIPATVIAGPRPLFPEIYFSAYADQDVESVPGMDKIAASLIRDGLVDTINVLDFNRNVTARYLMDLDCYFADGTFVKRATPFDELRNMPSGRTTWKPEDVAVDTVFSQLFQLPRPEHKVVYYHSVLTEACKLAPAAIAPSLGRAIRYLYRNSPRMDMELSYRFLDWFSHHLSNFGFTWKWAEWVDDAQLPDLDPRKWFLMGALDKEVRLSFAQRIQKTVPEPYQPLIGSEKEKDVPDFKFSNPETPFSKQGQEVAALLKRKAPADEIQLVMDSVRAEAEESGLDPVVASVDVLMTAICWVGSKSLSHVLACIDRVKARLVDAGAESATARAQIITSVMSYWQAHPGVALCIVQKLLNYSILTPSSIVDWALSAKVSPNGIDGGEALGRAHIFELVLGTVSMVAARAHGALAQVGHVPEWEDEVVGVEEEKRKRAMRELLGAINEALARWNGLGSDPGMQDGAEASSEKQAMLRRWGQRWLRVFQRMAAVEAAKGGNGEAVEAMKE